MAKRALCCGINYKRQSNFQLYGCTNDCLDWVELFKNVFQFDEVRVLIDEHPDGTMATAPTQIPSRANILAQLNWLCSGAEPGDTLAFVFAGHGCQVRSAHGPVAEALVPEDFDQVTETGSPHLVMDDELHALFQRLPAGSFITVVLDCCHGEHMLDVPCSMDCVQGAVRTQKSCERPRELPGRDEESWKRVALGDRMKHAYARPRFMPTVNLMGPPRQRRTPEGSGAHVGRMTLDPAVTAFCFSASRGPEMALDANIKAHQRGVMSFCLLETLNATRGRCTYQTLLEKASEKIDDIRSKYMPEMDQCIQLSFCPNCAPSEVVLLDPRYAGVSQYRMSQLAEQGASPPPPANSHGSYGRPPRDGSGDFVPAPAYGGADVHQGPPVASPAASMRPVPEGSADHHHPHHHHHGLQGGPMLYLVIHAAYNLVGRYGDGPSPDASTWVTARLGHKEHKTHSVPGSMSTVWSEHNHFNFQVEDPNGALDMEVLSADHARGTASFGRLRLELRSLAPGQWLRRREQLQDGHGAEIEFDVRLESGHQGHQAPPRGTDPHHAQLPPQNTQPHQPHQQHPPQETTLQRPPDPSAAYPPPQPPHDPRPPSPQRPQELGHGMPGDPPAVSPCSAAGPRLGAPDLFGRSGASRTASEFGGSEWGRSGGGRCPPGSIFGTPNLFGAVPHMLGSSSSTAAGSHVSASKALSGLTPPSLPSAALGLDLNRNGRADLFVQGVDLNRNGIPDALEGALSKAPAYGQGMYQSPGLAAMPSGLAAGMPYPTPTSAVPGLAPAAAGARAYGLQPHMPVAQSPAATWQYAEPRAMG